MITYRLNGIGIYEAANGSILGVREAQVRWSVTDPDATATYSNVRGGDGLPHSRLDAPDLRKVVETFAGGSPDPDNRADSHDSILEVRHDGGTTYVVSIDYEFEDGDDRTDNDSLSLVFELGGAALPEIDSRADFAAFLRTVDSIGAVRGGPFEPGDTIRFSEIADDVVGDARGNRLTGNGDDNRLAGKGGDDVLRGLGGRDVALGQAGDDRIVGGSGADALMGGGGRDLLLGGAGQDRLVGGGGGDRLVGGKGADVLQGGAGADRFVFAAGHGRDAVRDLDLSEGDIVVLRGTSGAELAGISRMEGDDLAVTYGRTTITFEDVGSLAAVEDAFLLV